jgi:hypothetical protein
MIKETQMQYNPREAMQQKHLDALQVWYERNMDNLDEALINGGLSQAEYNKQVKALNREFDEDYNDIFAG